ncbi:MAG: hypothetical protein SVX43_00845 [Cyanobacteriota bacterium]|nr:hypothetical protein [Cyanobacteriota bacterium]
MEPKHLDERLEVISEDILELAREGQGDCQTLLALLRSLEQLHRTIQEEMFQAALPNTRHELYNLLKEIEETGGWPYIARMKLQALTSRFVGDDLNPHLFK